MFGGKGSVRDVGIADTVVKRARELVQKNKIPTCIASIQWFVTTVFQVDRLFFSYDLDSKYLITTKILYYIVLLVGWCFGANVYRKLRAGDAFYQRAFFIFKSYLGLMMALLVILWPGTWSYDDLWTLIAVSSYEGWQPWQHTITGIYQDVLLQILPFPGGIILLQNVIISMCVSFSVTKLETILELGRLKNRFADALIKILPFLLPPVIMYQFSGYRMGLYVYLELVVLLMLMGMQKETQEWNMAYLALFCVLCGIVAVWRTESFFYLVIACVMVLCGREKVLSRKKKGVAFLILITAFLTLNQVHNAELGNANYKIISLLNPCAELVRNADPAADKEVLQTIDRVVDCTIICNEPSIPGTGWGTDIIRNGYTDEEYGAFVRAIVSLSLKYPQVVLTERWRVFGKALGVTEWSKTNVEDSAVLYDGTQESLPAEAVFEKGWVANKPVFRRIRKHAIYLLGCRKMDGSNNGIWQKLVWNAVIPLSILICGWFEMLFRKKWFILAIGTAVLIRVPIVFLTEPSGWIMYVLSFYLLGYLFLEYRLLYAFEQKKNRNGTEEKT